MEYPKSIEKVLSRLRENNYQAFLVGGCVRDHLMGRKISDFDITTDALPKQVQKIFASYPQHAAGLKHGTITIFDEKEGIEITTFRRDGEYKDARRPEKVYFTKELKEDLMRRDFTINALAFSQQEGVIDLFGGRSDIENRIIRAIGDPRERFSEDALRIFRAVRFASQLGFSIDPTTYEAMRSMLPLLEKISAERKAIELIKALMGEAIFPVLIKYSEIFAAIAPQIEEMKGFEQKNPHHIYDVLEHTARVIQNTPADKELRLAAFFHDMGKMRTYTEVDGVGHFYGHESVSEEIAASTMRKLKLDNLTKKNVCLLVRYHDAKIQSKPRSVRRWLNRLGTEHFFKLLVLKRADAMAQAPAYFSRLDELKEIRAVAEELLAQDACFQLKDLAVDGRDMIELGFSGKEIGQALSFLLEAVLDEKVENNKTELIQCIGMNFTAIEK
ncbi:MAG: HD domain-containing protein [Peptostreptococcaceae bacterium]|nr:HD domain-containing protein [Peptostreptococcaceae bacterium]